MSKRLLAIALLLLLLFTLRLPAQDRTITVHGTVTDNHGSPLTGASVLVRGTQNGASTDAKGEFTIKNVRPNAELVISFQGFTSETVGVGGRESLAISLSPRTAQLDDVVIVGYGTQRRVATTGSIASVKPAEITQTPVTNVAQGIQARVSGVQVTQNSAAPGGNISVRIRGVNSINGTSEPLYVVDGLQISNGGNVNDVSPLASINPEDIESVDILKDASATAIYGSRGANGVVLITTKRGRNGATRVAYSGFYGEQKVTKRMSMMDAAQFAALENQTYNNQLFPDPASLGKGTDWQSLIFRQAPMQSHQLSVSGGSEKTQMALSFNYFDQDGVIISNNFKRYSMHANIDHRVNDWIKVGASIFGSNNINNAIPTGVTSMDAGVVTQSILGAALGAPPNLAPYKADGSVYPFGDQFNGVYREEANPLGLSKILSHTGLKRILANVYGEANLYKGLTYRASFSIDQQGTLYDYYSPISILNSGDVNATSGSASKVNSNYTLLLHESMLTWAHKFATDHSLKLTGVFATQSILNNSNTVNANGFPNDATANEALQLAQNFTASSSRSKERLDSYMGRINYGFKDKYFLDLTARVDGNSKFGADHKYGFFPAASAAWRISEENFMKGLDFVSDLKLRGSYGLTGNAGAITPYKSLATVGSNGAYEFNGNYTTGISPNGISNPALKWETSLQADIGLDVSLFSNRVSLVADVYQKKTNNLLYVKTLPLSSGYANITGNFASLQNRGLELATNVRILEGPVKWDVSANISWNRNKVVALDGITQETFVNSYSLLKVGQPLGVFKTYVFNGIYQTGEPVLPGSGSQTGGVKVADLNHDGQITADDQRITGNPNPSYIFGFSTNLRYKKFDLSVFLAGSQGNDIYNLSRYTFENPLGHRNVFAALVNRWSPTNPSNSYIIPLQGGRIPVSDRFVEDGSYIRCKNITLGYTLPAIKGIRSIRVYASANNVFLITHYSGYDPEVNSYGNSNTQIGIDNLVYPAARSFLGGLQVNF
ncbi:MAG: TonB-dependent receptor [Bacteroidetes bacterium]|nr:TonB-dependent receptor [Bacteroidota bacterium]